MKASVTHLLFGRMKSFYHSIKVGNNSHISYLVSRKTKMDTSDGVSPEGVSFGWRVGQLETCGCGFAIRAFLSPVPMTN